MRLVFQNSENGSQIPFPFQVPDGLAVVLLDFGDPDDPDDTNDRIGVLKHFASLDTRLSQDCLVGHFGSGIGNYEYDRYARLVEIYWHHALAKAAKYFNDPRLKLVDADSL